MIRQSYVDIGGPTYTAWTDLSWQVNENVLIVRASASQPAGYMDQTIMDWGYSKTTATPNTYTATASPTWVERSTSGFPNVEVIYRPKGLSTQHTYFGVTQNTGGYMRLNVIGLNVPQ
jgi:hypothetical protein